MRCCIEITALLLLAAALPAQDGPVLDAGPPRPPQIDPSELDPRVREAARTLDLLRDEGVTPSPLQWAVVCEACGLHPALRAHAAESRPFPARLSADLLTHPRLAVRMGALEILEERTGRDSGFDAWEPAAESNAAALRQWREWAAAAEGGQTLRTEDTAPPPVLDEAKLRGHLVDLVGADVSRQERAIESLARAGMKAVAFLEQYLHDAPQLAEGVRGRVKQAQYRLVLMDALPKEAARLARDLVFGTRDQKLAAMQPLPRCREKAVPILAEFLPDSAPLLREAAMDALLLAGGNDVLDLVQERLKDEEDENVIHAVLRRVSPQTQRGADLIAGFLTAPREDLVVAALNALTDGKSQAGAAHLPACIRDPRWRVRVAAIEYAGALSIKGVEKDVLAAFDDSDEFVRYAAMKAAAGMKLKDARPRITRMALADDSLLGPAVEALLRMDGPLPADLVKALPQKSGESLLGVLRAFGRPGHDSRGGISWERLMEQTISGKDPFATSLDNGDMKVVRQARDLVRTLATHKDPDVSAMAVQYLAGIMFETQDQKRVLEALRGANADAQVAILESMLPGPFDFRDAPSAGSAADAAGDEDEDIFERVLRQPPARNPAQEAVYAAFGITLGTPADASADSSASAEGQRSWKPLEKEFYDQLTGFLNQRGQTELAIQAAIQLAFGGQQRAITHVERLLPDLEPHQRARMAALMQVSPRFNAMREGLPLLRGLLQDLSPEVRTSAVYAVLKENTAERVRLLLEEAARPEGSLRAADAYGYRLVNATEEGRPRAAARQWCLEILGQPGAREDARVLALVLLGGQPGDEAAQALQAALSSPSVWMRRAAWRSMLRLDRAWFEENAAQAARDPSPRVRETVAAAFLKTNRDSAWQVWFGERDVEDENTSYRRRLNILNLPPAMEPLLAALGSDPDPAVRVQAMLSLLGHGHTVEPLLLREAIAALGAEKERRQMLQPFLDANHQRLPPSFAFLLDHVEEKWFDADQWQNMNKRLRPAASGKSGLALATFASLVSSAAPAAREDQPAEDTRETPPPPAAAAAPLSLLFFHKPGCKECVRVRDMLRVIHETQPLTVEEHNIERAAGAELNQVLSARFQVDAALHQVTPAVFTQGGALVKDQLTFNALAALVEKTAALPPDADWSRADETERAQAGGEIAGRFATFSIGWVALAGLLDGINPCAFATIIFFLSYLRVARRSPREILLVGLAFITSVFLTYFVIGLGLSHLVAELEAFSWVRVWLNRLLALAALVLAWLSFRDGLRALRGRMEESALQLPDFLKARIRGVIRVQARSVHFIIAAFVSGILISLLELACTGQVYLPTIIYMMRQGSLTATAWLLLYNLAFILPLVVIFVLAWLGMTSDSLIAFQKKHTAAVRFATALLFLALWLVLLIA